MKRSRISWTDFSGGNLNVTIGCTPVSSGCANCYARRLYERWGKDFSKVTVYPEKLERLRTQAFPQEGNRRGPGKRPMCFVVDMGDLFHEEVPDDFIWKALAIMSLRNDVVWQIATKRPERMRKVVNFWHNARKELVPDHIWLGVSAEDQQTLDERVKPLLRTSALTRWVSLEPLLGRVSLNGWLNYLDWIVVGGESGPGHRIMLPRWVRRIHDDCQRFGVPCYIKQDSYIYPGKPLLIDGREIHQWPAMP